MQLGLFSSPATIDDLLAEASDAKARGFDSLWMSQIFGLDAITALAIVGREVPGLNLGTGVVPTYPRHPAMLAAQARTTQQASGGHFTLGIGLSHQIVIESMYGMPWEKQVRHLREYLSILMPLLHGEPSDFEGETLTAKLSLDIAADPVPVVVAALGPQLLRLAGRRTEGTVTWMTGPATIESHIAPSINAAAAEVDRPSPRIVCALPVAVTNDADAAREKAAAMFQMYGFLPSYRAMLDREGADGPADVAIIGTEAEVRSGIERVLAAGATEFIAAPFTEIEATKDTLQGFIAEG
jgi:F420-dependent oxidoreductase-like protein